MTDILFIHGFNGSPTGGSYTLLKERLDPGRYRLHTMDYNPADPEGAIRDIRSYCARNGIGLVIGTSLGGFMALNVTSLPRIVHNVCWSPSTELLRLGLPEQYADIYRTLEEKLLTESILPEANGQQEGLPEGSGGVRGVFTTEDELLGDRYRAVFGSHFSEPVLVSGPHRMNGESADIIARHLVPSLLKG